MAKYRQPISIFAFAALLLLSLVFIASPKISSVLVGRTSFWLLVIGLIAGGGLVWKRPHWSIIVTIIAGLIVIPFVTLSRAFGTIDVMSLLFHVQFGTEGASLKGLEREVREGLLAPAVFVFATFGFWAVGQMRQWVFWLAALALLVMNPMSFHLSTLAFRPNVESDLHTRLVEPQVQAPDVRPDVIIIYLEGVERTFNRTDLFGDVYAQMDAYEAEGLTFTNIMQVQGTAWTLAGLTATKCGVPPLFSGLKFKNNFETQTEFLTSRVCLPDILAGAGYRNSFILGSDQAFSGKNNMLASHNFPYVLDRFEMEKRFSEIEVAAALSDWVLDDEMLFDTALSVYKEKVQDPDPMFMVIETYGPHGDTATLSRNCTPDGQSIVTDDVAATVACTLTDMNRFIDALRVARQDRPTLVFLLSDHLNHGTKISAQMPVDERRNTAVMFSLGFDTPFLTPGQINDRPGSLMDLFPTMLSVIGFDGADATAGLGVSLFSDQQTLLEEKGLERLDLELFPNLELADAIWN